MIKKADLLAIIQRIRPHVPERETPALAELITAIDRLHKEAYPKASDFPDRMRWNLLNMMKGDTKKFPIERINSAYQAVFQAHQKSDMRFRVSRINPRTGVITCKGSVTPENIGE